MLFLAKNQKGIALMMTLLILSSVLIVSLGIAAILERSLMISMISGPSSVAYLAAESGAEKALWKGRKTDIIEKILYNTCFTNCIDFDNGTCNDTNYISLGTDSSYCATYAYADPDNTFIVIGKYKNIRRSIEVTYVEYE